MLSKESRKLVSQTISLPFYLPQKLCVSLKDITFVWPPHCLNHFKNTWSSCSRCSTPNEVSAEDYYLKSLHQAQEGTYILAPEPVNEEPYWVQENGKNSIWKFTNEYEEGWAIGSTEYLGRNEYECMVLTLPIVDCQSENILDAPAADDNDWPTNEAKIWRYFNNDKWIDVPKDIWGNRAVVVKSGKVGTYLGCLIFGHNIVYRDPGPGTWVRKCGTSLGNLTT